MKVALDARMIDHSGIGTAIEGWLEGFCELDEADRPEFVLIGNPERLDGWSKRLGAEIVPFDAPVYSLKEQLTFPKSKGRWKLLHSPHYNFPLKYKEPLVVTVHDLFHIKYGGFLKKRYQSFFINRLRKRDCPIVCVSKHTRLDLLEKTDIPYGRVTVVPNAVSRNLTPLKEKDALNAFLTKYDLDAPYLLWNGIDQPHKNLEGLFRPLCVLYYLKKLHVPFVISGLDESSRSRIDEMIENVKLGDRIKTIPRIGREEMPALFAGAMGLVAPSLEEGFGFVPLEAMAMGVPVAASDRPALPEVCGDAALMFDPADRYEMDDAIVRLANDEDLRKALIEKGFEGARQFSWRESARKLVELYAHSFAVASWRMRRVKR